MKTILVHLDETSRCRARLEIATDLARRFSAHLTGFYATSGPFFAPERVDTESISNAAETLFVELTAGISANWVIAKGDSRVGGATERTIRRAFYADLVIIGQTDPGTGQRSVPPDFPERLVLGAGRPVLVIPNTGEFKAIGDRAMVAWRGGKASSRALNDAIPFLQGAQEVHLSMVNPRGTFELEAEELCAFLARHGIKAHADQISANDVSAGNILLNQACDLGIDLIVLGVLARHRFGRIGLGPVGRYFLDHMTMPVLISS